MSGEESQDLNEYVIILKDTVSGDYLNLVREGEDDEITLMLWKSYNPVSLDIIWCLGQTCVGIKRDVILYQIKRIESAKEAVLIYDMS